MKEKIELTQAVFEQLLDWLDADRDVAGQRYEEIRRRLIKIFVCRGCIVPEELADRTILTTTVRYASREGRDTVLRYPMARGVGEPAYERCPQSQNVHMLPRAASVQQQR